MISESYVPIKEFREKRSLVRHRIVLSRTKTKLANKIHAILDKYEYRTELREFQRYGLIISETALKDITEKFRRERDIIESEDLIRYMQENELSSEEFVKMMEEEAKVELLNSFKP